MLYLKNEKPQAQTDGFRTKLYVEESLLAALFMYLQLLWPRMQHNPEPVPSPTVPFVLCLLSVALGVLEK